MCGITGVLAAHGLTDDDRAAVDALSALMTRRGPDDSGTWDDGRACALGFRRLSIIDLTPTGHQPMSSIDGRHVIVFNGELYNYRELRRELEAAGRRFRGTSDTEVALAALDHWGPAGLARFNGMFALAWYSVDEQRLVLARDPMGIKPLYWLHTPHGLVFGSQYDQVVRHPWCDRGAIDPAVLGLYLRLGWVPAPYGLVRGTGQVVSGHWLEVRPGRAPVDHVFRDLPDPSPPDDRLLDGTASERVAEVVDRAVTRQTVSDVPVGAFLSGGVDSPLVAAAMQAGADGPVPAFTIGTDDERTDESEAASAYAGLLGVEHHLRHLSGADALALVDDVALAYGEPFADFSSFPSMLVSGLARERVTVVLSGDGGDELFWGYPRFAKVLKARKWFHLPRPARTAVYGATKPLPVARRPARGVLFGDLGDWYLDAHSGLRQPELGAISPEAHGLPGDFDRFDLHGTPGPDALAQWMRTNELRCHLQMVLLKMDRASMFHSLEVRVPLLDLELVDLAARVDPTACLAPGRGKAVLRDALASHVPADRIPVPKKGFTVPMADWLRDDLRPLVQDLLLDRDPWPAGALDHDALVAFYDGHLSGRIDRHRGLWNLVALQLWADAHLRPLDVRAAA